MLEAALVAGLASGGAEVDLFGIATTPCMFYSIQATGKTGRGGASQVSTHRLSA
jgi:phosphomannomutase